MYWLRDRLFGRDPEIPRVPREGKWITILAIAVLVGVAWDYGIITSVALLLQSVVVGIWNMLVDVAVACRDFLQYVLDMRH